MRGMPEIEVSVKRRDSTLWRFWAFAGCLAIAAILSSGCVSFPLPEREGVVLYRAKCGGCHRPYSPVEVDEAGWRKRLPEMARRAHLTSDQFEQIRRYIGVEGIEMLPSHGLPSPSASRS